MRFIKGNLYEWLAVILAGSILVVGILLVFVLFGSEWHDRVPSPENHHYHRFPFDPDLDDRRFIV